MGYDNTSHKLHNYIYMSVTTRDILKRALIQMTHTLLCALIHVHYKYEFGCVWIKPRGI